MNAVLVYDTETTGMPDWGSPSESEHQPHLVQLAAVLVDADTRERISSMDVIVRPDGWTIPDEVAEIHGITTDRARDVGIPESLAVEMFLLLWRGRLRVAHNESFDARIMRIALMRYQKDVADDWKASAAECTARMSTPICAIPPTEKMKAAKRFHHKTPNLGEAYRHFTGETLEGAHNAMVDVDACISIYWKIKDAARRQGAAA